MPMGCKCKFFDFSTSYTILIFFLSILYLLAMLLTLCTFLPFLLLPSPADNPPYNLHFYYSVSVLVVCLVCFCFLDSVVDNCEFLVILQFIVLIFFFFLDKSFNMSHNKGLVMMNSFNFTLSWNHFICPSILNDSFDG